MIHDFHEKKTSTLSWNNYLFTFFMKHAQAMSFLLRFSPSSFFVLFQNIVVHKYFEILIIKIDKQ